MLESLLNKVARLQACEYCETFKNTYFQELLRTTASDLNQHYVLEKQDFENALVSGLQPKGSSYFKFESLPLVLR